MNHTFDEIVIIYNPNSTGYSEKNAKSFAYELGERMSSSQKITVRDTKHAGHAEEITAKYMSTPGTTLLVSSSGDGGYNEVINGVLRNGATNVVTAVLPSGNANDHARSVGSGDLLGNIAKGNVSTIEAIKVESSVDGKPWIRFAHSYVGFGLTPKVGRELTARKLNAFNEKWHTLYHLLKFKHVDLTQGGKVRRFSSLVFATVTQMSKILKLDADAKKNDGQMEVYETDYKSPSQLLRILAAASLKGMSHNDRRQQYEIRTVKPTLVQLDGEVFVLDANADVNITCIKSALRTVL